MATTESPIRGFFLNPQVMLENKMGQMFSDRGLWPLSIGS